MVVHAGILRRLRHRLGRARVSRDAAAAAAAATVATAAAAGVPMGSRPLMAMSKSRSRSRSRSLPQLESEVSSAEAEVVRRRSETVVKGRSLLSELVGSWHDEQGSSYEVKRGTTLGVASCDVTTYRRSGAMRATKDLIRYLL